MSDAELFAAERRRLRAEYAGLFDAISAALFRDDPMGINFGDNTDEYEPEVETILPRLKHCTSAADVTRMVHEQFCHWFGAGPEDAGPVERYAKVSAEIWQLWSKQ